VITLVPPLGLAVVSVFFFALLRCVDRRDLRDSNKGRLRRFQYRQHYWRIVLFTLFLLYPGKYIDAFFLSIHLHPLHSNI
jgi:hypothetical protein